MKLFRFQNFSTGEFKDVSAHTYVEAGESIGVGYKLFSITK